MGVDCQSDRRHQLSTASNTISLQSDAVKIMTQVFLFVSHKRLLSCRLVCRHWNRIICAVLQQDSQFYRSIWTTSEFGTFLDIMTKSICIPMCHINVRNWSEVTKDMEQLLRLYDNQNLTEHLKVDVTLRTSSVEKNEIWEEVKDLFLGLGPYMKKLTVQFPESVTNSQTPHGFLPDWTCNPISPLFPSLEILIFGSHASTQKYSKDFFLDMFFASPCLQQLQLATVEQTQAALGALQACETWTKVNKLSITQVDNSAHVLQKLDLQHLSIQSNHQNDEEDSSVTDFRRIWQNHSNKSTLQKLVVHLSSLNHVVQTSQLSQMKSLKCLNCNLSPAINLSRTTPNLTTLVLNTFNESWYSANLENPTTSLKDVTIHNETDGKSIQALNQIFPSIQKLTLSKFVMDDFPILVEYFQKLEHLSISFEMGGGVEQTLSLDSILTGLHEEDCQLICQAEQVAFVDLTYCLPCRPCLSHLTNLRYLQLHVSSVDVDARTQELQLISDITGYLALAALVHLHALDINFGNITGGCKKYLINSLIHLEKYRF